MPSISIISEPQAHHYLQQTRRRRCMGLERRIIQSLPDFSAKIQTRLCSDKDRCINNNNARWTHSELVGRAWNT